MNANRFDSITRFFASGRLSRRRALATGGSGLAAGAMAASGLVQAARAQVATPEPVTCGDGNPMMLFLQAFQGGSVVAKPGAEGRYLLTLEQGLGHTVYFSDRPDRLVGSVPTPDFLAELGFPDDNPPNATLVVEMGPGQTEIAVLELFNPSYDNTTHTAIYEVAVLAEFERSNGFGETHADLAELLPRFDAAHLFIDDCVSACPAGVVACFTGGRMVGSVPDSVGICCGSVSNNSCAPSVMWGLSFPQSQATWDWRCNAAFDACNGECTAAPYCAND